MLLLLLLISFLATVVGIVDQSCILQSFQVRSVDASSYAAEVLGLDLQELDDSRFELVNHFLLTHKVLVFRNQSALTVEGQRAFSKRFGPLQEHIEASSHLPGHPDVNLISNEVGPNGEALGLHGTHVEMFHADLSWETIPSKVTVVRPPPALSHCPCAPVLISLCMQLKSIIRPLQGGETEFTDSTAAFASLPQQLQQRLLPLQGHYSYLKYRPEFADELALPLREYLLKGAQHPLIAQHPITGAHSILANPSDLVHVLDAEDQGLGLMDELFQHLESPQFKYTHRWQDGDVLVWDNRAVQHRATAAPSTARRLIRTTSLQEAPPRSQWEALMPSPVPPCLH